MLSFLSRLSFAKLEQASQLKGKAPPLYRRLEYHVTRHSQSADKDLLPGAQGRVSRKEGVGCCWKKERNRNATLVWCSRFATHQLLLLKAAASLKKT